MARTIPPLNPLHVFEVTARLGNFTKAAQELRVTQSAVSRQIATLEDYLDTKLFLRESKGVALTKAGQHYSNEIGPAFSRIAASTEALMLRHKSRAVRIASYPTFAVKWLIPRMSRFSALNPKIDIGIKTSILPVNFGTNPVDVAIQLRKAADMDVQHSRLLFQDVIQPYCSPSYLKANPIRRIGDLRSCRILHSHYRQNDWSDWLKSIGHPETPSNGVEFPSSLLTYKAATEGLGVTMGQCFLLRDEVREGLLVPLFEPVQRDLAYYVTWRKKADTKIRRFIGWLVDEIARKSPDP